MGSVTPGTSAPTYRLVRPAATAVVPDLDDEQRRVVEHAGGPLLVLAGPGTGKTTTLVEAIVRRIDEGAHPDSVLALTFSRKAAEQLRDRVAARVGRTMSASIGSTFHSFAYGLIRRYAPAELYVGPLRLLSAPEQDVVLRELLQDHPESVRWPDGFRAALETRGFAREVHAVLSRAREKGLDGEALQRLGEVNGLPEFVAAGRFLEQYLTILDDRGAVDYSDLIRRATIEATVHRDELRATYAHVFVDEYQDTDSGQVALLQALAGDGRPWWWSATRTSRSTRSAALRCAASSTSRREFPQADGSPADVVALDTTRRFGPRILTAAQRVAGRIGLPGSIPEAAREAFLSPQAVVGEHGEGRVVVTTFDTDRGEAEHLADLLRRAHLEDGIPWDQMAVLVRSGRQSIPPLRRSLGAAGVPVEVASDEVPLVRDPAALPLIDALRVVLNLDNHDPDHVDHIDAARAEALLTGPLGGLDAGDVRRLARELRQREKEAAHAEERLPLPSRELVRRAVLDVTTLEGLSGPEVAAGPSRRDPRPHDTGPGGRGCDRRGAPLDVVVRYVVAAPAPLPRRVRWGRRPPRRTATSTRSARCSMRPPGPRRRATTSGPRSSWPRSSPSRSPPTRWRSAAPAAPPCASSPRTGPRGSSGGWSSSRTSSRTAGPTFVDGRASSVQTGSAPTVSCRPRRCASCWSRSVGCSTSRAPAPASAWSSPRSPRATTTATSPPGSWTSWA